MITMQMLGEEWRSGRMSLANMAATCSTLIFDARERMTSAQHQEAVRAWSDIETINAILLAAGEKPTNVDIQTASEALERVATVFEQASRNRQ